jgi:predicted esterase YcpF (UPF0227 family)
MKSPILPCSSVTHLLYLHGFRSSPNSFKARVLAQWVQNHQPAVQWVCPQLPASPQQAIALALSLTQGWPQATSAVVGSSLGGFYAQWLARTLGMRSVLLNPAVRPARDLASQIGTHPAWHDTSQQVHFQGEFVDELLQLEASLPPARSDSLAIIAKGDEVLDWQEMLQACQHGQVVLLEDSDHGISDFESHLPEVISFLGWD